MSKELTKLAFDLSVMHHSDDSYPELKQNVRRLAKAELDSLAEQPAQPTDARACEVFSQGERVLFPLARAAEAKQRGWQVRYLVAEQPAQQEQDIIYCPTCSVLSKDFEEVDLSKQPAPMSQPNRVIAYAAAMKLRELGYKWADDAWTRLGELAEQPAQQEPDDSLLLCASDLEHSAIFDNHSEMQSCIRAVASRIKPLAAPQPAQRKPLADEQREVIAKGWRGRNWTVGDIIDATEAAHGIKDNV